MESNAGEATRSDAGRGILTDRRALLGAMGGVAAGAFLAGSARAGELTPPGAPAPTMKPLDHVEPRIPITRDTTPGNLESIYRITQPGSYYLTENLIGLKTAHGILILTDGVTIDLMGFVVQGVADSLSGIGTPSGEHYAIRIVNGIIRGWGEMGISLGESRGLHIACIHCSDNGHTGIMAGSNAVVESCTFDSNTQQGIQLFGNGSIIRCAASNNGSNGISGGVGAAISECTAAGNVGTGITGGIGCLLRDCTSRDNGLDGFSGSSSTIVNCTATSNSRRGFSLTSGSIAMGNTASANSGPGINALSSDNRIEGNNCRTNGQGIVVLGTGNLILRNTCSGNTGANWDIAANNIVGTIISAPPSGVINGDTGGAGVGSVDPWANFTY